jgi:hypothetical protein
LEKWLKNAKILNWYRQFGLKDPALSEHRLMASHNGLIELTVRTIGNASIVVGTLLGGATLASIYFGVHPITDGSFPQTVIGLYRHARDTILQVLPFYIPHIVADILIVYATMSLAFIRAISLWPGPGSLREAFGYLQMYLLWPVALVGFARDITTTRDKTTRWLSLPDDSRSDGELDAAYRRFQRQRLKALLYCSASIVGTFAVSIALVKWSLIENTFGL